MEEGEQHEVTAMGTLGCQEHLEPYQVVEIKTSTDNASRRFLLMCPVPGCGLGIKLVAPRWQNIRVNRIKNRED